MPGAVLFAFALAAVWVPPVVAAGKAAVGKMKEANAAYAAGQYEAALEAYAQAEVDCPACPEIAYNRALVHYRMRDFTKARELFNEALATRDLELEARAKFNLGNVAYAEALEKRAALAEAIEHARRAIYHYRDALDLDPEDADARANIETAQLLIKDLLDKQKKQQEQQQDQESEKQDQQCDNPQEQQQGEEEQNEDQEGQPKEESQSGEQEQNKQEQPQQAGGERDQEQGAQQSPQEQEQAAAPRQEAREMTRAEAQRMLQAVRDKEARRREERARRLRARHVPASRDW